MTYAVTSVVTMITQMENQVKAFGRPFRANRRVWSGEHLAHVDGRDACGHELAFHAWCHAAGHLSIRTVDLFWALDHHSTGFPTRFSLPALKKDWRERKAQYDRRDQEIRGGLFIWSARPDENSRWSWYQVLKAPGPKSLWLTDDERQEYMSRHFIPVPDWPRFCAEQSKHFEVSLSRYREVQRFLRHAPSQARTTFLRCRTYGRKTRVPAAYPDYFVVFEPFKTAKWKHGFVEVKGPRESLRPSQREFFPELIRHLNVTIWLARWTMDEAKVRLRRFTEDGRLIDC